MEELEARRGARKGVKKGNETKEEESKKLRKWEGKKVEK